MPVRIYSLRRIFREFGSPAVKTTSRSCFLNYQAAVNEPELVLQRGIAEAMGALAKPSQVKPGSAAEKAQVG